ncbi:MAG: hypothetical protein M3462_10350, partial [Chloroflexota bacterium]|nr:hypothetical protein [Chloroflexota bacterium]
MPSLRRTLRLTLLSALLATALLLSPGSALANHNAHHATGPQPVPLAACNEGAANARTNLSTDIPARDAVPHQHNFFGTGFT